MKILLAEDDHNISKIARMALEHIGHHQVTAAQDGQMALELALNSTFDLILLDEMMPKMNGLTVCRAYQSQKVPPASPVIFLSAKSQESDIAEFEGCALGFIAKPFDPMQLCQQIDHLLKTRRQVSA